MKDEKKLILNTRVGDIDYFPAKKFRFNVDSAKVIDNGTVSPDLADKIVDEVKWAINKSAVGKNHLMVMDLLATNNWERPIYFAITTGNDAYLGLTDYFQLEGLTYRLIPVKGKGADGQIGRVNTDVMYDNVMNNFRFGNIDNPDIYLDETNMRMTMNLRNNFYRLAKALINENKFDSAKMVMDRCLEVMPNNSIPYDFFITPIAEGYYKIGEIEKANEISLMLIDIFETELEHFFSFTGGRRKLYDNEKQTNLAMLQRIMSTAGDFGETEISERAKEVFDEYYQKLLGK